MNSDEDASLAQLRTARGGQGAAGGGGDKGRGQDHNWSPKVLLRTSVTPGANALHNHNRVEQDSRAAPKLHLLLGLVGSPWPG